MLPVHCNYQGHVIETVNSTTFLGVQIDEKLSWKAHTEEVCARLSRYSYTLFKLSKLVDIEAVKTAYHGYVASTLRFGLIYWGNSTNREAVFKAQKRCVRAMCGLKLDDSCLPYFKEHKILTLPCLFIFEIALFVKSNLKLFTQVSQVFKKQTYRTHDLCIVSSHTALKRKSMFCMSVKIFNKLPLTLRLKPLHLFKTDLKNLLMAKCYYSLSEFFIDKDI